MKSPSLLITGILLLVALAGLTPAPAGAAEQPSTQLDKLVAQALKANPDLKAAEARWHMYERKVIPAKTLDDPMLSVDFSNYPIDSFSGDETPMTGKDLKLSQKFPFPGKLAAKGQMADQQALWYKGGYEDLKLRLVKKVKDAYYRLFFLDRAIAITKKNISILDDFIRLTETRYKVGKGLQSDVLKAQVERSKLVDRLFTLKQRRVTALADLNTLLDRPTATPVTPAEEMSMTPVTVPLDTLKRESEKGRPLFAAYNALVDRFKAQRRLAKLDYWPDVNVWAGYRQRESVQGDPAEGTDFASVGVTVNLPIWREKRHEQVAEAESGTRMALHRYNDFRTKVYFSLQDAYAQMEKNRDLVSLYKTGIIPQANQTYQADLSAYQVDKVDFLTLLDSLLTVYRYQIDYYQVLSDYQQNVAALAASSGVDPSGPALNEPSPSK